MYWGEYLLRVAIEVVMLTQRYMEIYERGLRQGERISEASAVHLSVGV